MYATRANFLRRFGESWEKKNRKFGRPHKFDAPNQFKDFFSCQWSDSKITFGIGNKNRSVEPKIIHVINPKGTVTVITAKFICPSFWLVLFTR